MQKVLYVVTGAPGAGKSAVVDAFLGLRSDYVVMDMDCILDSASALAGKDIRFESATWQSYNRLWFDILAAVFRNGRIPIWFTPLDRYDIEEHDAGAYFASCRLAAARLFG